MTEQLNFAADQPQHKRKKCCIVGGGPAGVFLAWLLARQGISLTLLERHSDFERDFRGDTLHPGVLEILDQVGLAEQVLRLAHTRMQTLTFHAATGSLRVADLRGLKTKFPFIAMLPQSRFLQLLVTDAQRFDCMEVTMGADAQELIQRNGVVCGVRYVDSERNSREVYADLIVAADGRTSRMRRVAGLAAIQSSPEIDVLWFRIPRLEGQRGGGFLAAGAYMIVLQRDDQWQIGYVIAKGQYQPMRAAGIDRLRESVVATAPGLAASAKHLTDWRQVQLLSVQADRLKRWYRPGLLFLGDAAHVMSPVGGVGINYAIQDAVEAANLLADPLREERLTTRHLRAVQRRRQWPTRFVQTLQAIDQRWLIEPALCATGAYRLPLWIRLMSKIPFLRSLPSRWFAFGIRRVSVRRARDV